MADSESVKFSMIPEELLLSGLSHTAIVVWGVIQRHANADGKAFPSHQALAEKCKCGDRSIRAAILELKREGWLIVTPRFRDDGSQSSNLYTVVYCRENSPTPCKSCHPPPANLATPPPADFATLERKPDRTRANEREDTTVSEMGDGKIAGGTGPPTIEQLWDRFRLEYPKGSGILDAAEGKVKFKRRLKEGVDPCLIIDGARRYRLWCDAVGKTGTEFVKAMPSFLSRRVWEEIFELPNEGPSDSIRHRKEPLPEVDYWVRDDLTGRRAPPGAMFGVGHPYSRFWLDERGDETDEPFERSDWFSRRNLIDPRPIEAHERLLN